MLKFRWETEFRKTEIGEIPKDWEAKELGKIIKINKKPRNADKKPIAFISMENILGDSLYPKFELKNPNEVKSGIEVFPGSLLLAKITPSFEHGKSCIVPKESNYKWIATTEVFSILPKDDMVDLLYLFYFFKISAIREGLQYTMTGTSGRQRVPKDALEQLEIPYPPPEEQTRIATVLSWFDDLIENKRKQNEILEKTAMAIFKSWFIDFEPFQDEEFVYSEELDMEIPEGWGVKPIGEVADFTNGLSYKGSEKLDKYKDGAYVFITLKNVEREGGFKLEYAWIKSDRLKEKHLLKDEELIMANTDMTQDAKVIGSPALVVFPFDYVKDVGVYSHHITRVRPIKEFYKLYLYLTLKNTQKENITFSTGTNVLGLDIENFKKNKYILLPPQPILQRFHSLVEPLFQKIITNQKQIMTLKKIRDTLLPQLVFGRLRIDEM